MNPLRLGIRADIALLVLRLVFGAAFIEHGFPKIMNPIGWIGHMVPGTPPWLAVIAAAAEFVGGIALMLGLITPLFAFLIGCNMVVAIFIVAIPHGAKFVAKGPGPSFELELIYLAVALLLLLIGPGSYSADAVLFKGSAGSRPRRLRR